jgi:hypothetical protein
MNPPAGLHGGPVTDPTCLLYMSPPVQPATAAAGPAPPAAASGAVAGPTPAVAPPAVADAGSGTFYFRDGATYDGEFRILNAPPPTPEGGAPRKGGGGKKKEEDTAPPAAAEPPKRVRHGKGERTSARCAPSPPPATRVCPLSAVLPVAGASVAWLALLGMCALCLQVHPTASSSYPNPTHALAPRARACCRMQAPTAMATTHTPATG